MLDPKLAGSRYRIATKAVSLGRPIDPRGRAKKLSRALAVAKASGADHVVISGDLTELGDPAEIEHLANVLHDARIPNEQLTLVPGNHDAYTTIDGWKRALEGPLAPWAKTSATEPGKVVDRGAFVLIPVDVTCFQSIVRSGGEFTRAAANAIETRLSDPAFADRALVLVLHHPPVEKKSNAVWSWIDALRGSTHVLDLLARHPRVQLLHGHLHRVVDRMLDAALAFPRRVRRGPVRIFGAPAVVDDGDRTRVRLYDVRDGLLESAGLI